MMLVEMNNMGFGSMGYIRSNARKVFGIVAELKTTRFESEHVGKLNFFVTAVKKQLTGDGDNPTKGSLICRDKDNVVAEYSLEGVSQPIGIAGYK